MADAKSELANTLREAAAWLARPDKNFDWSSWEDADEALAEVSSHVDARLPVEFGRRVRDAGPSAGKLQSIGSGERHGIRRG